MLCGLDFVLGNSCCFSALIPHHKPQRIAALRCYQAALGIMFFFSLQQRLHMFFSFFFICSERVCIYVSAATDMHSQISLWFVWVLENGFLKQLKDVVGLKITCLCVCVCSCVGAHAHVCVCVCVHVLRPSVLT